MFDPDAGMPRINRVMVYLGRGDVRPNEVALNSPGPTHIKPRVV